MTVINLVNDYVILNKARSAFPPNIHIHTDSHLFGVSIHFLCMRKVLCLIQKQICLLARNEMVENFKIIATIIWMCLPFQKKFKFAVAASVVRRLRVKPWLTVFSSLSSNECVSSSISIVILSLRIFAVARAQSGRRVGFFLVLFSKGINWMCTKHIVCIVCAHLSN